jgi:branched-chain amino acid transport system ATP-binding protein
MTSTLRVEHLRLGYGELTVVPDLSFHVNAGEVLALLGPNGAGKSTIMRGISGLIRASAGEVWLNGTDISRSPAHDIVRAGLRHVPEGRRVFGSLSVRENLVLGAYVQRSDRKRIAARAREMYDLFPILGDRRNQLAGMLSGGEQQMLALARALMTEPQLLALDEPSLGLSPLISQQILALVRELASQGTAVLLVEQNAPAALEIADRAHVLELGAVVMTGTGSELAGDPRIRKAYLGADVDEEVAPDLLSGGSDA